MSTMAEEPTVVLAARRRAGRDRHRVLRHRYPPGCRAGGAGALAPSHPRRGVTGRVHPTRRGQRLDRAERALGWQVATLVARVISSGVANDCPARAWRRNSRHQPSWRLSQQAPLGMKVCWMRGWSISQVRVETLEWLDRLSVITMMAPVGLAVSTAASRPW